MECSDFDYSDNFNRCSLKFSDNGFRFEFYDEGKVDSEVLEIVYDQNGKWIIVNEEGPGSYGCMTSDNFGDDWTPSQINKYMTATAADWISRFIQTYLESK